MEGVLAPLPGIAFNIVLGGIVFFGVFIGVCCGFSGLSVFGSCLVGTWPSRCADKCCKLKPANVEEGSYELVDRVDGEMTTRLTGTYQQSERKFESDAIWLTPFSAFQAIQSSRRGFEAELPVLSFRDKWAAVIFLANAVAVLSLAVFTAQLFNFADKANEMFTNPNVSKIGSTENVMEIFFVCVLSTCLFGFVLLSLTIKFPETIIKWSLVLGSILLVVCSAAVPVLTGNMWMIMLPTAASLIAVRFYKSSSKKIPFSSAVISVASKAVCANYTGIMSVFVLTAGTQAIWIGSCMTAYYGLSQYYQLLENRSVPILVTAWLSFSLFWGSEVLQNIMHCTVCGSVGNWWFIPSRSMPVRGSMLQAVTVLFGTVCFGSLFVALIQTLNSIISSYLKRRKSDKGCSKVFRCLVEKLLSWFESCVKYFNKYSFCYVSGSGTSYLESGKKVSDLFYNRGWTAIINDNFISTTLMICTVLGTLTMGTFAYVIGAYIAPTAIDSDSQYIFAIIGALLGFGVSKAVFGVVEGSSSMVFVCLAEDPKALQSNHPNSYIELEYTWNLLFTDSHDWRLPTGQEHHVAPASIVYGPQSSSSTTDHNSF